MKTICIQIGNSDDKLTQFEWSNYTNRTDNEITEHAKQVHFYGCSYGDSIWQNAAWVFEIEEENIGKLRVALKVTRELYKQDSIAWLEGQAEFV